MPKIFSESQITFTFSDQIFVCRPENCLYYQGSFQKFCGGSKEMDFLAYDPETRTLWLLEVKDYRYHGRTKLGELAREVALKVRDALALLRVAAIADLTFSGPEGLQIGDFSRHARHATSVKVVLHCELATKPSKLQPLIRDAANIKQTLRRELRAIDAHPILTNRLLPHPLPWQAA